MLQLSLTRSSNKRYQSYGFNFFNFFCRKRAYQEHSHSFHTVIRIWSEVIHETIKMPNKYSKLLLSNPHQRQEQSAKIARYKGQKPFFCNKRLFNIKLNNNTRVSIHFILEVSQSKVPIISQRNWTISFGGQRQNHCLSNKFHLTWQTVCWVLRLSNHQISIIVSHWATCAFTQSVQPKKHLFMKYTCK